MSSVGKAYGQRPERIELVWDQFEQLPTLPAVAARVLQATNSNQGCTGDVAEIISSDQSLSARIISLARNTAPGASRSVETVDSAVAHLGFDAVRHAVLSITVFEVRSSAYVDAPALWKHALAVGCASRLIAERWPGQIDPEVAFVCGLLHDMGKVALAACLPKSYERVVGLATSRRITILAAEQEILGVDHTVVGKRLAQRWNLPVRVAECNWLHHHTPDMLPEGIANPDLVRIVNLANVWVAEQGLGSRGQAPSGPSSQEIAERVCLPIEHLSECAKQLPGMVEHRAAMLGLEGLTSGAIVADAMARANAALANTCDRHHVERPNQGLAQVNLRIKAAQEELVRARALQFVAEMAGGAAHELNNPLAVISGRAELLARQTGDERIKKGLEIIVEQAHRCSGIVNELMEFAKPATPRIERITLADLVEDEVGEWSKGVSLQRDQLEVVISDRDISIDVDVSQIRNALREVLDNAYAACDPEEAFLKVNCSPDTTDEIAVIVVQDNGQGMDREVLEKAGAPFFSGRVSGRGRGLGLSRAMRWCETNGGTLELESTPGKGTSVWMKFPVSRESHD